jgi:hypothetical protein
LRAACCALRPAGYSKGTTNPVLKKVWKFRERRVTFESEFNIKTGVMKRMNIRVTVLLILAVVIQSHAQQKSLKCGDWRWDVKSLTDKEGAGLLKAKPVIMDFGQLLDATAPRKLDVSNEKDKIQPRFTSEKEVVEITAYITSITITQDDHDFSMVLKSPASGATMLAELPNPDCASLDKFPAQRAQFKKTWKDLSLIMEKISGNSKPVKVKITGVRFWDAPTGGRGESPNGLEIHPVLSVTILPD